MLQLTNVSKFYGSRQALDGVTFSVRAGETMAVLGAHGSGKSTVLRVLSGYLDPTNGSVRVNGQDPRKSPQTRRTIGYLPEGTPLPPPMRVGEYLRYRAGLKGISGKADVRKAVQDVFEVCPLAGLEDRLLFRLDRNDRQWVGIADALLGGPEILLLDELTAGMDARQADEARALALAVAGDATTVVTGRNLAAMEKYCKRVVLLNQGRVVADGDIGEICREYIEERRIVLTVVSPEPVREAFRAVPGVRTVTTASDYNDDHEITVAVTIPSGVDLRHELSQICADRGWLLTGMRLQPVELEDLFRRMPAAAAGGRT